MIVITKSSKVFITPPLVIKQEELDRLSEIGSKLVNPPPAEIIPINQALKSPIKKKVSIAGRVVQQDEIYHVDVRGKQVPLRNIFLDDGSSEKCKVTLWRDVAIETIQPGDHIEVTNVVVNLYKNEASLSTTSLTSIKKTDVPVCREDVTVIGISILDENVEILLLNDNVLTCKKDLMISSLPKDTDLENLTAEGTVVFHIERRGGEVISLAI